MNAAPLRLRLQAPRRVAVGAMAVRGLRRERVAVRIRLHDDQGRLGLGEALPLPGYSRDDADGAERLLAALARQLAEEGLVVPAGAVGAALIEATLAPHAQALAAAPSARFALECALLDLLARRAGVTAAAWLAGGRPLQQVPVSVLLPDDVPAAVAAAAAAAARGHRVLKLKIGARRPRRGAGGRAAGRHPRGRRPGGAPAPGRQRRARSGTGRDAAGGAGAPRHRTRRGAGGRRRAARAAGAAAALGGRRVARRSRVDRRPCSTCRPIAGPSRWCSSRPSWAWCAA